MSFPVWSVVLLLQPTPKYSRKEIPCEEKCMLELWFIIWLWLIVNSEEFIQLKQDEVREDEMFFYK